MNWIEIRYYNELKYITDQYYKMVNYIGSLYREVCVEYEYEQLRLDYNNNKERSVIIHGDCDL